MWSQKRLIMKKLLLNILALYMGTITALGQGTDSFFTQPEWSDEIRDPEFITLYIAVNNFEDPAPLTDGIGVLLVLMLLYLVIRGFMKKDTKK